MKKVIVIFLLVMAKFMIFSAAYATNWFSINLRAPRASAEEESQFEKLLLGAREKGKQPTVANDLTPFMVVTYDGSV